MRLDTLPPLSRFSPALPTQRPPDIAVPANMFATHLADSVATLAVFAASLPAATPANPLELRAAAGDAPMRNQKAAKTAMLTAALNFATPPLEPGEDHGDYPRHACQEPCPSSPSPARRNLAHLPLPCQGRGLGVRWPVRQLHVDTLSATQIQCPVAFLAGTTAFPCTRTRGAGARHRAFGLFEPCRPPVSASARRPTISGPNCRTTCTP